MCVLKILDKKKGYTNMKDTVSAENCHRTHSYQSSCTCNVPSGIQGADDSSDQDSSTSKYVVENDNRERRDGPGGN